MPGRWRGRAPMPGRFAETVGLDDSFEFFSWEESRPWRGLGRLQAPMPGRWRGRQTLTAPRVLAIRAICAKSHKASLNIHSPRVPCLCAICAIWPYIAHILQIFARTE